MKSKRLFLLLLFFLSFFKTASSSTYKEPYRDPNIPIEDRVDDLLSRMTLPEKIGQMAQIDRSVASSDVLHNFFIGSVLSGGGSTPDPKATPSLWADMVDGLQKSALSTRLQIPILYGIDAVHGHNNVLGATIFPHNIALGAARDESLMVRIGRATALEVRGTGIQYTFAPCIAVCKDPRWGRCYESYSEDTETVRSMAKIILGLQGKPGPNHTTGYPFVAEKRVVACAKHYGGDGGTEGGVNEYNTNAIYPDLFQQHLRPYIDAVSMGVSSVMASYSSWNGVKMHANIFLLSRVLKLEMGFKGFVISDWEGVDRITSPPGQNYNESLMAAINAGIDMVMLPNDYKRFITDLTDLVSSGKIQMSRIDDAVRRILRVKFTAGMFERPMADRSLLQRVGHKKHRELAREAVRKSLVLLKNGNDKSKMQMLPLSKNTPKILVAGTHANDIGLQCGGWTITWNGAPGNTTIGTTILEGIKGAVSKKTEVIYKEKPDKQFIENKKKDFSYAIVAVGEPPYAETSGDSKDLTLPLDGVEIITNVCTNVKCVVIIISGRPLVIEPYMDIMDAVVAAWLPGSEAGKGIADVIFGDYNFRGRLPRTWFRHVDQLPMLLGDAHYDPLFPFGFGLSMNLSSVATKRPTHLIYPYPSFSSTTGLV